MNYSKSVAALVILLTLLGAVSLLPVTAQDMVGTEITSITTVSMADEASTVSDVAGDSEFADGTFTVNFLGLTEMVTAIAFDGGSGDRVRPAFR